MSQLAALTKAIDDLEELRIEGVNLETKIREIMIEARESLNNMNEKVGEVASNAIFWGSQFESELSGVVSQWVDALEEEKRELAAKGVN